MSSYGVTVKLWHELHHFMELSLVGEQSVEEAGDELINEAPLEGAVVCPWLLGYTPRLTCRI